MKPSKEQLEAAQWQQAISGSDGKQHVSSSQMLIKATEQAVQQLESSLLGYHYENRRKDGEIVTVKIEEHSGRKLCNEKAVGDFKPSVKGIANTNTIGSNLSDKNIADIAEQNANDVAGKIFENLVNTELGLTNESYEIDGTGTADQIVDVYIGITLPTLRKAKGGFFADYDSTVRSVRQIETKTDDDDEKGIL